MLRRGASRKTLRALVRTALGQEPPDLVLYNGNVVNVVTEEVEEVNVAVKAGRIALLSKDPGLLERCTGACTRVDVGGLYVLPGLVDSHTHVESSLAVPSLFAYLQLREGVTVAVVDPHEVTAVAGRRGLEALVDDMEKAPLKFLLQIPPCVPPLPELETAVGLTSEEPLELLEGFLEAGYAVGLAELMCYPRALECDEDVLLHVERARARSTVVDGHASDLREGELQAYVSLGVSTDHSARTPGEVLERLARGLYVQVQRRRGEQDFTSVVEALRRLPSSQRVMWATDDVEADELWRGEGSVRAIVVEAVETGMDPIRAVQMATINPAQAYGVDTEVGLLAPGRYADTLITRSLERLEVDTVISGGEVVVRDGRVLVAPPSPSARLEEFRKTSVTLPKGLGPEDLLPRVPVASGWAEVNVLTVERTVTKAFVEVRDHVVLSKPNDDVAWACVIDRYGGGSVFRGFVKGTGLREGALATSVSHDAHNLLVVGQSAEDMYASLLRVVEMGGGLALTRGGRVLAEVGLPYFGLLSSDPELPHKLEVFKSRAKSLGLRVPLKRVLFLTLTVGRGGFAITDKGLFDCRSRKAIPLVSRLVVGEEA